MKEVICPLLTTNTVIGENGEVRIGTQPVYCLEEQCAWFAEDKQKCAVAVQPRKDKS